MAKTPKVAIIGRPNVGKSTLFNRLIQKRVSIMADEPGVTRDRLFHKCIWLGKEFDLIDTGGYSKDMNIDFQKEINAQVEIALHEADLIIFLASAEGIQKEDLLAASFIRDVKKPVILGVNKSDNLDISMVINDFYKLGLGDPIAISSIHGIGVGDLLDRVIEELPKRNESEDSKLTRIGVIGKPNVGKSTLINAFLNDERVIVSEVSGTTRDAIDSKLHWGGTDYILTDTAGIKRNKRALNDIEWYAELRSKLTINGSDITLLILDPSQGIAQIDERVMSQLMEEDKATIIVVNKVDLLDMSQKKLMEDEIRHKFKFVPFLPILFISAMNRKGISKIFDEIVRIDNRLKSEIQKGQLNEFLMDIQMMKKPPRHNGMEIKLKFISYENKGKPTFIIFANKPEYIHFSYKRFIENQIRQIFEFEGIPLVFKYKR